MLCCNHEAICSPSKQPFFITSIPKSGTNMYANLLKKLTGLSWKMPRFFSIEDDDILDLKSNEFLTYHMPALVQNLAIIKKHSLKGILVVRDPRDLIVAASYFIGIHINNINYSLNERIRYLMTDFSPFFKFFNKPHTFPISTLDKLYHLYLPWKNCPLIKISKFEDLVGSKGGGCDIKQKVEIEAIAHHLNIPVTDALVREVAADLWGKSDTFRNGKIGAWKTEFTPGQKMLFKKLYGNLLIELGYETSNDW